MVVVAPFLGPTLKAIQPAFSEQGVRVTSRGGIGSAEEVTMKTSRLAAAAMAALVAVGTLSLSSQSAEAGWRRGYYAPGGYGRPYYGGPRYYGGYRNGWNPGAALAVGAITGLAVGALAASAPRPYYYAPAPAYYPPAPVYVQPNCFWQYYPNGARAWVCT